VTASARRWRWLLVALVAAALLIRIPPLFAVRMWHDEAVEGLMSQDILRGRFPIFFYGQPAHGAADRYLAALALWPVEPSAVALKPPMLALFLAFLGSVAYTTRRVYGSRVAALATLFVAVPPYYYFGWTLDSRGHYPLMLLLGVWLLHLAWRIGREGVLEAPRRRFVGLGLLAGLGWWTNYLSATFLVPVALGLAWQGARALRARPRAVLERAAIAGAAAAVGMAPLLGYFLSHGLSLRPPGRGIEVRQAGAQALDLVVDALPPTLGVHPEVWGRAYGAGYVAILAVTVAAIGYGARFWLRARRSPAGSGTVGALLAVVALTCALSIGTAYGAILRYPRYLLPLMLALPVLLGLMLAAVGRRSPGAMWALVALLALNNLLGSLRVTPVLAEAPEVRRVREEAARARAQLRFLERHGIRHVYGNANHWSFLSGRRVLVSDPYRERMAEVVREVDAAGEVAWVFGRRAPDFEAAAHAAGIRFRVLDGPGVVAYAEFRVRPTGYVDLDPAGWAATASHRPEHAAAAHDGRLDTAWAPGEPQAPGQSFRVDLGAVAPIGFIAWMPRHYQEVPAGFEVTVSRDGQAWEPVARVPAYPGAPLYWAGTHPFQRVRRSRIELRIEPVEARHVRITLTARRAVAWSIRELTIGRPAGDCPRRYDPDALVALLQAAGVTHVHADHWISANVAKRSRGRIRVLPANVSVNSYRLERPHPDTIELVRPRPDRAIVVEDCPAAVADTIAALLGESGVRYRQARAGGFVAFTELRMDAAGAEAVPWRGSTAEPVRVELTPARPVDRVILECAAPPATGQDGTALALEATTDGRHWEAVPVRITRLGKLRLTGSRLFRDGIDAFALELAPRPLRAVRVAPAGGGPGGCPVRAVRLGFAT
jgi:hypothetical protein